MSNLGTVYAAVGVVLNKFNRREYFYYCRFKIKLKNKINTNCIFFRYGAACIVRTALQTCYFSQDYAKCNGNLIHVICE